MCISCVAVAGVLVVSSQLVPIETLAESSSSQRTISAFSGSSSKLSAQQISQIKSFVGANPKASTLNCTTFTQPKAPKSKISTARSQAAAACRYAKQLRPSLKTSIATKASSSRNLFGRTNLLAKWTVKSEEIKETPVAKPDPGLQPISPWAVDISSKTLGDAAQLEFRRWAQIQSAATVRHQVFQNGSPNPSTLESILKGDAYISKLFSQFIPRGSFTLISDDKDWLRSKATELGIQFSWGCTTPGDRFDYCLDNDVFTGYLIGGFVDPGLSQVGMNSLPMHEYFHNVQAALSNTPRQNHFRHDGDIEMARFPAWWLEGAADFVGFVSYAEINGLDYSAFKNLMMTANPGQNPNSNALKDYEIRRGEGNGTIIYPYNMGRIATEYLVASGGFQKMLDVHLDYRSTNNFRTSFKKIYGFSVEEFYEKFEAIRLKVGLPPVTMEIRGTENVPKP